MAAVEPIVPYIKGTAWCPFDTEDSAFVKVLRRNGVKVVHTHIATGDDFFETERECDVVVSNPPYSLRTPIIKRLYALGKPWAMLFGMSGIFENKERVAMYKQYGVQVMYLSPRVQFIDPINHKVDNPPFQSGYVCWNLLPKDLMFATVRKEKQQIDGQMDLMSMLADDGQARLAW